jgi:hypothetical protein
VRFKFNKNAGLYRIDVRYLDESDGTGLFEAYVNSTLVGSWTATVNNDLFNTRSFNNVRLNPGDVIKVVSRRHQDELGRLDYVDTVYTNPAVTDHSFNFDTRHELRFTFGQSMNGATFQPSDVQVQLKSGGPILTPTSVSYVDATHTATFAFASPLPSGDYTATLTSGSVADTTGKATATADVLPFYFQAGDANHDRVVDVNDLNILAANWLQSGRTFSLGNLDYSPDGLVDQNDLAILSLNWQQVLAPPLGFAEPIGPIKKIPTRIAQEVL